MIKRLSTPRLRRYGLVACADAVGRRRGGRRRRPRTTRRRRPGAHVAPSPARSGRRRRARQATMRHGTASGTPSSTSRYARRRTVSTPSQAGTNSGLGVALILLSWALALPATGEPQGSFERLMEAVGKSSHRRRDPADLDDGSYRYPRSSFDRSDDLDDAGLQEPPRSFERLMAHAAGESSSPIKRTKPTDMDGSYRAYYMNDYCNAGQKALPVHLQLHSDQAGVVLYSHRRNSTPRSSVCQLPFQVENAAKFTLSFRFFDTVSDSFICFMYLELVSSTETTDLLCGKDYTGTKSMVKASSSLTLRWTVSAREVLKRLGGFEIVITGFQQPESSGCAKGMSRCSNDRCVWNGFKCDGKDNCGDFSDERLCFAGKQDFTLYLIALFVITLMLLAIGVVFKIMYNKYPVVITGGPEQADANREGMVQTVLLPGPPPAMVVRRKGSLQDSASRSRAGSLVR
ncbi:uncharacterized protein [Dermacentor andersoni]|uniref:uncharacterized protein n=1 Tax=Dermacentor andersoni TaxID=34620 RepID=UPI002416706F|nr:uncharacterized protein LOC126544816 [Dermacentor andersoni]